MMNVCHRENLAMSGDEKIRWVRRVSREKMR
jgi:hypothetical protein